MFKPKFFTKVTIIAVTLAMTSLAVGYVEVAVHNPFTGSDSVVQLFK